MLQRIRPTLLRALILFALALAVRLYRLGAQSLWLDEGSTWAEVTGRTGKGWGALLAELWSPNAAYPLYHLLLRGWLALAGDSEWALRFPSALAGAAAVVVLWLSAREIRPDRPLAAYLSAACMLISPFALWHAQDAKVYSLLLLTSTGLLWALLRVLRSASRARWLTLLGIALVSVFVHRLALLALAGITLTLALTTPWSSTAPARTWQRLLLKRWTFVLSTLLLGAVGIVGTIQAVGVESHGGSGHIQAGPLLGVWLSLMHFSLDQGNIGGFLGLPLLLWGLPALALTVWGIFVLLRDAHRGDRPAIVVLSLLLTPLLIFAAALAFTPNFEARYVIVAFPAWALTLSYPFFQPQNTSRPRSRLLAAPLFGLSLLVSVIVLFQPKHGLFSGAPVKEQWREGVSEIAHWVHPDDLLMLQPYYVQQMWDYYAPRVTPDPLPQPVVFANFAEGDCAVTYAGKPAEIRSCYQRRYEPEFNRVAYGKKRMLMLAAPDHAQTVDPPKTLQELIDETPAGQPLPTQADRYGWLGLRFQYASEQRTWPCGGTGDALIGVEVLCASFPSFFGTTGAEAIPEPTVELSAIFGDQIKLRGYTITPAEGVLRSGGTLPITLYWEAISQPTQNYTMFLHLCRDCSLPPLAQDDRPPLNGFFPAGQTTTWQIGDPVHDERTLLLQKADGTPLPPGRYTLLLGVYPAGEPDIEKRLSVTSTAAIEGEKRLVLGEIEIVQ